jgi:hypothetical protein
MLIYKMMRLNPKDRIDMSQALKEINSLIEAEQKVVAKSKK